MLLLDSSEGLVLQKKINIMYGTDKKKCVEQCQKHHTLDPFPDSTSDNEVMKVVDRTNTLISNSTAKVYAFYLSSRLIKP